MAKVHRGLSLFSASLLYSVFKVIFFCVPSMMQSPLLIGTVLCLLQAHKIRDSNPLTAFFLGFQTLTLQKLKNTWQKGELVLLKRAVAKVKNTKLRTEFLFSVTNVLLNIFALKLFPHSKQGKFFSTAIYDRKSPLHASMSHRCQIIFISGTFALAS